MFPVSKAAALTAHDACVLGLELGRGGDGLVLLRAQDFLIGNEIRRFEDCRRDGHHIVLDSTDQLKQFEKRQRIIFFSHQWTSWTLPDPTGEQYRCMVAAVDKIVTEKKWKMASVWIWCDYISIPQLGEETLQLAIQSLSAYCSVRAAGLGRRMRGAEVAPLALSLLCY